MVKIETENKDKPKNKSVLLFSGGMDSLIMNHLLNPDILLVIPHGNSYQKEELDSIQKLIDKKHISLDKVIFDDRLRLDDFERDDAIIPNRNLYFITLATHYGETIYLGSVYGDRSLDKSKEFFKKCEDMFNYLYQEQHWCESRKFSISAPYKDKTKSQLVKEYLNSDGSIQALKDSYSCYEGSLKPCGKCKPCFRKWVSFQNNYILSDDYFQNNPSEAEWIPQILEKINSPEGYRGKEDLEIKYALDKNKWQERFGK